MYAGHPRSDRDGARRRTPVDAADALRAIPGAPSDQRRVWAPTSRTGVPASFLSCRAGICELLAAGVDMAEVERTIEAYALDRDEKSALWLWAIGRRRRPRSEPDRSPEQRPGSHTLTPAQNDNLLWKGAGHD